MKRFLVVVLAAVAALLVGPMSIAYAGGMGLGNNVAFNCYLATGEGPGGTMDLHDRFGVTTSVKIGGVKLYCTDVFSSNLSIDPNSSQPAPCDAFGAGACDLKCYDVRSAKGTNAASQPLLVSDFFLNEALTSIGAGQVVCVGAEGIRPTSNP
jgi:hypothetical protein